MEHKDWTTHDRGPEQSQTLQCAFLPLTTFSAHMYTACQSSWILLYRTGRLSEEEKARRLAEMSGNAEVHEEARWARLQAARKRDDSEAALDAAAREKAALESEPASVMLPLMLYTSGANKNG